MRWKRNEVSLSLPDIIIIISAHQHKTCRLKYSITADMVGMASTRFQTCLWRRPHYPLCRNLN